MTKRVGCIVATVAIVAVVGVVAVVAYHRNNEDK